MFAQLVGFGKRFVRQFLFVLSEVLDRSIEHERAILDKLAALLHPASFQIANSADCCRWLSLDHIIGCFSHVKLLKFPEALWITSLKKLLSQQSYLVSDEKAYGVSLVFNLQSYSQFR